MVSESISHTIVFEIIIFANCFIKLHSYSQVWCWCFTWQSFIATSCEDYPPQSRRIGVRIDYGRVGKLNQHTFEEVSSLMRPPLKPAKSEGSGNISCALWMDSNVIMVFSVIRLANKLFSGPSHYVTIRFQIFIEMGSVPWNLKS